MKICPFCEETIDDHYPYCPFCNKPLISNLRATGNRSIYTHYNNAEYFSPELEEETKLYEDNIIQNKQINEEIKKIDEILERKEILGDPIPGTLFLEKSSLYYKKRDLPSALNNLEIALKNFEVENDLFNVAICHNEIGLIQEDQGFFDQAIYHFNRTLEIVREANDIQKIVKVLNNLGNTYYLIKDLEHSYKNYQEALDLAKQENLTHEEIKTSSNLVEVLYLLKDYNRIKRILDTNLNFFKENDDLYGTITIEIKYGKLFFLLGEDYDLAYHHLNNAWELIKGIEDKITIYVRSRLEWECLLYLGKLNEFWGNLAEAENYFIQSLEAVRVFEIGESINEGEILECLAELQVIKNDMNKGIEYYILACEIAYKYGNNQKCAEIKYKIGECYLDFERDKSNTLKYFKESLEIYEDLNFLKESAEILQKLGDLYIDLGMPNLAIEYFEKSKENYNELKDTYNFKLVNEKIRSLIID
ncbi:MAG: tetratricopeptide repeat protein [Candidatus Thorarchaeota archaeon]